MSPLDRIPGRIGFFPGIAILDKAYLVTDSTSQRLLLGFESDLECAWLHLLSMGEEDQ